MDANGKKKQQISQFETHPVRHLTMSKADTLAFTQHGQLFTQVPGQPPKELEVRFRTDAHDNDYITTPVSNAINGFAVSPNGKEIAFVARGEVFVTSRDFTTTRRITNTAEQERSVSFHPDGRTLLYAGERGGKWKLYESTIADKNEKYFFAATQVEEEEIHSADRESFQPAYSPDGKQIAYLSGRDEIQVLNRDSGATHVAFGREHNYSYSDGDIAFTWSPDSQWLISDYAPRDRLFITNIDNTSDRMNMNSNLSVKIINQLNECEIYNFDKEISQYYIFADSNQYISNVVAEKKIKEQNTEELVKEFINKITRSEMVCKK